jgi:hypothetical protein
MLALNRMYSAFAVAALLAAVPAAFGQNNGSSKPFQLGATTDQYNPGSGYPDYPSYPAPQMIPQQPKAAPPPQQRPPMQAAVQQQSVPVQRPIQAQAQAGPPPGVLPGGFMGGWMVLGQRAKVEAQPQYQAGIDNIFTMSNTQKWNIVGQPGRYSMSSDSGVSSVQVGQCTANTAFIRYQHQIKNTMAREAIVLQISPDGRQFQGMQRISIVKPGETQPRATVTYNLMGQRQ